MKQDIVKVAIDAMKGRIQNYSSAEISEGIREALIEKNGGVKIDPRTFRQGYEIFDIVQELLPAVVNTGLRDDNPIFDIVDYRNIADGDVNEFVTSGAADFVVADVASGIAGIRRQRITGGDVVSIRTSMKFVRVYENLGRLLSGNIDFNQFIDGVAKSMSKRVLDDAYAAINAISASTAGLSSDFVLTGSFDEDETLELAERVGASTGSTPIIIGTMSALRKLKSAVVSNEGKSDFYNMGYYGRWNGIPMIRANQSVDKNGNFLLNNNKVLILGSDDKPIKVVNSGTGYLDDSVVNADMTKEYRYGQEFGVGVICAEKLGVVNVG